MMGNGMIICYILDWPQLPPLPNNEEVDESEDSEPDDSMEDSRPT